MPKEKLEIRDRFKGHVIASGEYDSLADLAVVSSADLRSANLSSADLRSANLSSADLSSADLRSANLRSAKIGGYELTGQHFQLSWFCEWGPMFAYIAKDHGLRIILGCRHFSAAEAIDHWMDRGDRKMTRMALDFAIKWASEL